MNNVIWFTCGWKCYSIVTIRMKAIEELSTFSETVQLEHRFLSFFFLFKFVHTCTTNALEAKGWNSLFCIITAFQTLVEFRLLIMHAVLMQDKNLEIKIGVTYGCGEFYEGQNRGNLLYRSWLNQPVMTCCHITKIKSRNLNRLEIILTKFHWNNVRNAEKIHHPGKVLLSSFHLNGHMLTFHPQI